MNENDDSFWGDTPDWTAAPQQPARASGEPVAPARRGRQGGVTSALKNLWGSAMSAGADATREHRIIDATDPLPVDEFAALSDRTRPLRAPTSSTADAPTAVGAIDPGLHTGHTDPAPDQEAATATVGMTEAPSGPAAPVDGDPHDDGAWPDWNLGTGVASRSTAGPRAEAETEIDEADFAPVFATRNGRRDRTHGGVDPLLARIGAVIVVLTLLVPLAIGLRSNDGPQDLIAGADTGADEAPRSSEAPSTTPVVTADTAAAAAAAARPDASESTEDLAVDPETVDSEAVDGAADDGGVSDDGGEVRDDVSIGAGESTSATAGDGNDVGADSQPSVSDSADGTSTDASDDGVDGSAADDASGRGSDETADVDTAADRQAPGCAVDYTVVAGDFWIRLADAAGVGLAELLEANDATVDTALYPGRDICLPAGSTTPAPPASTQSEDTSSSPTAPTTAAPTTAAPATTAAPTTAAPTTAAPTTAAPTTAAPTTAAPTTAAPTTEVTTTTASPPPSANAGPEEVKQIIRDVWPDELEDRALEIAFRESSYVPTAKNYCCYGLFQIYWTVHEGWLGDMGITSDQQLYDPETNARAAYALYQRAGGWGPWGF